MTETSGVYLVVGADRYAPSRIEAVGDRVAFYFAWPALSGARYASLVIGGRTVFLGLFEPGYRGEVEYGLSIAWTVEASEVPVRG